MNLKKLLINNLFRRSISKKIRNFIGIRPSLDTIDYNNFNMSTSDAFFWRTDKKYQTIFRLTNILDYFYGKKEDNIKIIFFDKNNKFIKELNISNPNLSSEILIDCKFLNNIKDYGVFYVFHEINEKINTIIRNSCYTGYIWNNNIPSMVHGNTITAQKNFSSKKIEFGIGGLSFFKKTNYVVQNNYHKKKTEILIVNPTKYKINFNVNNENFKLHKGCSKLISISDQNSLIEINSNCYLLRPIIFEQENDYLDVYHG